jgi:metallophosphoesterase superfamily enzyme
MMVVNQTLVGGCMISHGDVPPDFTPPFANAGTWVIGHQHPAVVLRSATQQAKMPCYARCAMAGSSRILLLLPAFTSAALGTDLGMTSHWLPAIARPANARIEIFGLIEPPPPRSPEVLFFGRLDQLLSPSEVP